MTYDCTKHCRQKASAAQHAIEGRNVLLTTVNQQACHVNVWTSSVKSRDAKSSRIYIEAYKLVLETRCADDNRLTKQADL